MRQIRRLGARLAGWLAGRLAARAEAALAPLDDPGARRDCPGGVACAGAAEDE